MKSFGIALWFFALVSLGRVTFAQTAGSTGAAQAKKPQVTAQRGQSPDQQQQDFEQCYDIAKAKTGIDLRELSAVSPGVKIPGMESLPSTAAGGLPAKAAARASAKAMLADEACLKTRGYLIKNRAPKTAPPKQ
jgi:hypothetical protein